MDLATTGMFVLAGLFCLSEFLGTCPKIKQNSVYEVVSEALRFIVMRD